MAVSVQDLIISEEQQRARADPPELTARVREAGGIRLRSAVFAMAMLWSSVTFPSVALGFSVTFVSPGFEDEQYWVDAINGMRASAQSLGISLEVMHADRDPVRQVELVSEVTGRPEAERPDYLLLSVEKATFGPKMALAEAAGIDVFLAYNALSPSERILHGLPRERYRHFLGTLVPRAEEAGELTATALLEAARSSGLRDADGYINGFAVSGDRSTDSSIRRNRGMREVFSAADDARLYQEVYADWRRDHGRLKASHLLVRYPDSRFVWTGNDLMAFGAMEAAESAGLTPGRDILFSTINTSTEAMNDLISGRLSVLAGGHYMTGAWSLVVLYDYHHGVDFAESEGLDMEQFMFHLFTPETARVFLDRFSNRVPDIDFRPYSKYLNPGLERYRFGFGQLLEAAPYDR